MNRLIVFACAVLLIAAGLTTTSCIVANAERAAQEAQTQAAFHRGQRAVLEQEFKVLDQRSKGQEQENLALEKKVADLERKLRNRPVPAPPAPVPNTDPELTDGLVSAGMAPGLRVLDEAPSTMFRTDAKLTWAWKEDAARVPGLEAHVAARIDLEKGMKEEIGGLKGELQTRKDALAVSQSITQNQATEIKTLNLAAQAAQKEAKAQYVRGWVKAVAAAAIGYGVGRVR